MAEGLTSFVMTWNFIKFSVTILIETENVKMYLFTVHIINKLSSTNRHMLQTYHSGKQTVQWSVLEQKNSFFTRCMKSSPWFTTLFSRQRDYQLYPVTLAVLQKAYFVCD